MRYGINIANIGEWADARRLAGLAREAEAAGWDGVFLWDHLSFGYDGPVVDPWIALAAMALSTERVRLGTLVTPLARRRPAKLARETVSLDHLSGGRLVLGVGLGHP
ncbi:MAG: LLM class flavin-dependent oxidoreductase, partial [Chloroflexota bacterium]|nr:LLM class flavin-dependent oxidoreductase [Chloroflexota bacterium]